MCHRLLAECSADEFERLRTAPLSGSVNVHSKPPPVQGPAEFDEPFATMSNESAEALIVVQSTIFEISPYRIQQLATRYRMYGLRTSTDAGGLMSYGSNVAALYAYSAVFVDKFLKGVSQLAGRAANEVRVGY
jgi:hypothetical protein